MRESDDDESEHTLTFKGPKDLIEIANNDKDILGKIADNERECVNLHIISS